jgi:hypothetical protein
MSPPAPPAATTYGGLSKSLAAHGALMAITWGVLFPGSLLGNRHLKPSGGKAFLYVHVGANVLALLFFSVAFGLVNQHVGSEVLKPDHYHGFHAKLGLSLFILIWFQAASGALRPHAPKDGAAASGRRKLWEHAHHVSGRILLACGLLNVFLGLIRARTEGATAGAVAGGCVVWVLWAMALGAIAYALEKKLKAKKAVLAGPAKKVRADCFCLVSSPSDPPATVVAAGGRLSDAADVLFSTTSTCIDHSLSVRAAQVRFIQRATSRAWAALDEEETRRSTAVWLFDRCSISKALLLLRAVATCAAAQTSLAPLPLACLAPL